MQVTIVTPQQQAALYTATTLEAARKFLVDAEQSGKWRRTERITPAIYKLRLDCLEEEISALERITALPEVKPMLSERRNEVENLQIKLKQQTYTKCTIKRIIPAMEDLRRAGVKVLDLMRDCEGRCKAATDKDCLYQYKSTAYKLYDLIKGISTLDLFETTSENYGKISYQEKEFNKAVRYAADMIYSRITNLSLPTPAKGESVKSELSVQEDKGVKSEHPSEVESAKSELSVQEDNAMKSDDLPTRTDDLPADNPPPAHGRGGRREGSGRKTIEGKTRFVKMSDDEYAAFRAWLRKYRAKQAQ